MVDDYKTISEIINEGSPFLKTAINQAGKGISFGAGALAAGLLSAAGTDMYDKLKHNKKIQKAVQKKKDQIEDIVEKKRQIKKILKQKNSTKNN